MLGGSVADLGHDPYDRHAPLRREIDERIEGGPHRRGVGVVRVVQDERARGGAFDLHAHAREPYFSECCRTRGKVATNGTDTRNRRGGVVRHVTAADRQPHIGVAPRSLEHE